MPLRLYHYLVTQTYGDKEQEATVGEEGRVFPLSHLWLCLLCYDAITKGKRHHPYPPPTPTLPAAGKV